MSPLTPDALRSETSQALTNARRLLAELHAQSGPRTADNTLLPFHEIQRVLAEPSHRAGLFSEVHPERPVREAAEKVTQELSAFATELSLDQRLFRALAALDASSLPAAPRRYLEHALRDFRRAGVDKDEVTR